MRLIPSPERCLEDIGRHDETSRVGRHVIRWLLVLGMWACLQQNLAAQCTAPQASESVGSDPTEPTATEAPESQPSIPRDSAVVPTTGKEHFAAEIIRRVRLPMVAWQGAAEHIHTQGLFVTQHDFYVTGRFEGPAKRPLLVRFSRQDPAQYEIIDLREQLPTEQQQQLPTDLDHPGGFDFDFHHNEFRIPLARSERRGPSVILRVKCDPHGVPHPSLRALDVSVATTIDDHIGALCFEPQQRTWYGANWDTQQVHIWNASDELVETKQRGDVFTDQPNWQLAVQDWKTAKLTEELPLPNLSLVGAIDKSPTIAAHQRAVIALVDLPGRRIYGQIVLAPDPDVSRPLTNEGLAFFEGAIFLLPEDLNGGAQILELRIQAPAKPK